MEDAKTDKPAGEARLANMVSVYGSGVSAPRLQTNDARLIQIRGADGALVAMMFKLTNALWAFTTPADEDWEEHRRRLEVDDSEML